MQLWQQLSISSFIKENDNAVHIRSDMSIILTFIWAIILTLFEIRLAVRELVALLFSRREHSTHSKTHSTGHFSLISPVIMNLCWWNIITCTFNVDRLEINLNLVIKRNLITRLIAMVYKLIYFQKPFEYDIYLDDMIGESC